MISRDNPRGSNVDIKHSQFSNSNPDHYDLKIGNHTYNKHICHLILVFRGRLMLTKQKSNDLNVAQ